MFCSAWKRIHGPNEFCGFVRNFWGMKSSRVECQEFKVIDMQLIEGIRRFVRRTQSTYVQSFVRFSITLNAVEEISLHLLM